jgi:phosphoribosylaminoimidazole-succinocarboxamide synthase
MIEINPGYPTLRESNITGLPLKYRGKVRDIYQLDDGNLCIVATDRISAFDRVLDRIIPHKGYGLTHTSVYAFRKTEDIVPNHLEGVPDPNVMIVTPGELFPIESIVRGTLTGSAWRNYDSSTGQLWDHDLPRGMVKNQRLEKPIVTPSTKAEKGQHDEYITHQKARETIGNIWDEVARLSLLLYDRGNELAARQEAFIADTKFEFGLLPDGTLGVFDEMLTHDSSRGLYREGFDEAVMAGTEPKWLDKEIVRKYLKDSGFTGEGEPPSLSDDIVIRDAGNVLEFYHMLTGGYLRLPPEPPTNERIERNLRAAGLIKVIR